MKIFDQLTQMGKMLKNLDQWIAKAEAHATNKKFELDNLAHARLAPDQYPFTRQVQSACDSAKFCAAYMSGKTAPAHPDTEKTIPELRARIHSALAFIETVTEADCNGAEDRKVAPAWLHGKWVKGDQYMMQLGVPNFYFHIIHAYAILRHNGVDLGKMDFMGSIPLRD